MTPADRVWLLDTLEIAIRQLVDSLRGDGLIAVHNFRLTYQKHAEERLAGIHRQGEGEPGR
jgi:hypothetical protein